jgi:hypothetical protein
LEGSLEELEDLCDELLVVDDILDKVDSSLFDIVVGKNGANEVFDSEIKSELQAFSNLEGRLVGLKRLMGFDGQVRFDLEQILLEEWIVDWVENEEEEKVEFVAMGTDVDFELLPFVFDVELALDVFERPGKSPH